MVCWHYLLIKLRFTGKKRNKIAWNTSTKQGHYIVETNTHTNRYMVDTNTHSKVTTWSTQTHIDKSLHGHHKHT